MKKEEIKKAVRDNYANIVTKNTSCCGPSAQPNPGNAPYSPCCGNIDPAKNVSKEIGYTDEELASLPEGANLGLGCGNPVALASLKEGDTYSDLGSGAGIDCFLAAKKVGDSGKVIGVDMTHEMLDKAWENTRKNDFKNVEFRLGEIEHLPVADNSVDVITSNCVINLSTDKKAVFDDAFRVLKPGGRLMISDIVLLKALPDKVLESIDAYVGCVSGAMLKTEYLELVKAAGFTSVEIISEVSPPLDLWFNDPNTKSIVEKLQISLDDLKALGSSIVSLKFSATKPNLE